MKKILVSTPFLAGEELICWLLSRLTGLLPFYTDLTSGLPAKTDEDWFTDDHFTVGRFTPVGATAERLLTEKALPIFLVRNIYDLWIDHYRYFSGENSVFWREYLAKMSKSEGIATLIAGSMSSGFTLSGMDSCCRQMQEMLRFSAQHPCCIISYEKLLANPDEQIQRVTDFMGIELTENVRRETGIGFTREIEALTGITTDLKVRFRYGLSCAFHDMLSDVHLDMLENILEKYAPDLGSLSEMRGVPEVTARSAALIKTRRKRIFAATIFKSGTKLLEYVISELTSLSALKFEEEGGSDYENAELIRFDRGSFFIWHHFPNDEVKAKIRAEAAKPIFLLRNIYDLLVSQYYHFAEDVDASIGRATNTADYFEAIGRDEGISLILCGATSEKFHWHGFGYSLRQMQEMLLFSKEYPCHIIIFDRLVLNKKSELERLAAYLEIDLNPKLLNTILNGSSLETMREAGIKNFGSGKHFRKGIPGDHVNVLKPHHYHMISHIKMTQAPMLDKLCKELGFDDIVAAAPEHTMTSMDSNTR